MNMKEFGTVDYSKQEVPKGYKCSKCGAKNCKLWRDYQTFLDNQTLLCAECAGKEQEKDVSTIDEQGKIKSKLSGSTDQIGWRVPAVPTVDGDTFWGYCAVPPNGVIWWQNLPSLPV